MSAKTPFEFSLRTLYDCGKASFDVAFCLNSTSSDPASSASDHDSASAPLKAHSCVLELHGQVFVDVVREARARCAASSTSTEKLTIRLVDVLPFVVTEDVLEVFVKYLYYGTVEVFGSDDSSGTSGGRRFSLDIGSNNHHNKKLDYASQALLFKRLYLLARHFRLAHLEGLCLTFFDSVLAPDKHALDVLDFGRCYGILDLVAMVIDVVETSKSFFGDPEILALIRKDAIEFICSAAARLPVPEHIVVEWLLIWKQAHNNVDNFDRLSQESHLHFEQFQYDFLAKILNSGLLSDVEMMKVYKDKAAICANHNNNNDNPSQSPNGASKPVTPCALIRYNGASYEVGFGPTELPAKLKSRFMRHIAKSKVDDDVDIKRISAYSTTEDAVASSMSSLRGDRTLAQNGIVDGSVLIAVPKPKLVIKVVATKKKRYAVKRRKKTNAGKSKGKGRRKALSRDDGRGFRVEQRDPSGAHPPVATPRVESDVVGNVGVDEAGGETQQEPDNHSFQGQIGGGDSQRRRKGSFEVKFESLPDSPPHCRATASECSSVDAVGPSNDEVAVGYAYPARAAPTSFSQDSPVDNKVRQNARDRVFWWKSDAKGPKLSAAESCIPAIKTSKSSPNLLTSYGTGDAALFRGSDVAGAGGTNAVSFTPDASSSKSDSNRDSNRSHSPAEPNLDDSGLSLDRSRSFISEAEMKTEPEINDGAAEEAAPPPPPPPPPAKKLRQRGSRKRPSQETVPAERPTTSQTKSQSRSSKRPKGSRSRESVVIAEGGDGAGTNNNNNNRFPPAPEACFKQSAVVVENWFEIGMKLEVPDPKAVVNTICIATVVDKIGPRLRLRLDGTDDRNDIWRLVNDSSLRSIGTCERRGQHLQPPVSFRKNISTWRKFLFENLKDAKVAPETCFISEPQEAQMTFTVGQRLEAVDRKNEALICPATVAEVTEKELLVHFDGWNPEAYDYWCDRNSRDLFPVGWCRRNHHPLQLIGQDSP